mgnify:CR=1 FL=1
MDYAKIISAAARDMRPSGIRKFFDIAAEMKDCISLGVGEPDFKTPWTVRDAGIRSLEKGRTWYTSNSGLAELREETCNYLSRRMGLSYTPGETVVTVGGSEAIDMCIRALVNPGDEVIILEPAYISYLQLARAAHARAVPVHAKEENGWLPDLDELRAAVTPKTKLLVLNTPGNPTGVVYPREVLQQIAALAQEQDFLVLSDEVYEKLIYGGAQHVSIASLDGMKERTITINGFSKAFAMTGWRIGFAAAGREIVQVMSNYLSHSLSGTCSIAQAAAEEAFGGSQAEIEAMRRAFEVRRDYLYQRMSAIPGVHPVRSEATFYMLMNLEELVGRTLYGVEIRDADDFANVFLREGLVAVVPCTGFGAPHYVRWSFAVSMENIKEGLDRLEKFLANA